MHHRRVSDIAHPVRLSDLFTQWRPDWLTVAVLAVVALLYARARLRVHASGRRWPIRRDAAFAVGLSLALWTSSGFPEARNHQLMWVWTMQVLLLLLVVPTVLVAAQPVALARAAHGGSTLPGRLLGSRAMRVVGHPAVGLLYVPVLMGALFFWGLGDWTLRSLPAGWALHVVLLGLGVLITLPLVDIEDGRTSLAVGLSVAIGAVELLVDAIPGIVLRLETHLEVAHFGSGRPPWSASWLADQQTAGGILWTVAELLDLPFLILVIVQWMRIERREAVRIDAQLDRAEADRAATATPDDAESARPWWMDHPELSARFQRRG